MADEQAQQVQTEQPQAPKEPRKPKTPKNLLEAFSGEGRANRKYLFFAKKADEEGQRDVAELFRKIAEEETHHAFEEAELMALAKSTKENLQNAIDGEVFESTKMYPKFSRAAKKDGNLPASERFAEIAGDEAKHAEQFREALKKLESQ
jgi:rubrerythrin